MRKVIRCTSVNLPYTSTPQGMIRMSRGRMFDCGVCLNRHHNGKCKSLSYPPAGNTCGWYLPPQEEQMSTNGIRGIIASAAETYRDEFSDVFPEMSILDWSNIISNIPSIRSASGSSSRRRVRGITTDNMAVTCEKCGADMDVDSFVKMVRSGGRSACTRCGNDEVYPISVG